MNHKQRVLALAVVGSAFAASAFFVRHYSRHLGKKQLKEDLNTWEGEGGAPAVAAARPVQAL